MAAPAHSGAAGQPAGGRRVVLAGATGLVGGRLLRRLLADDSVSEVHAYGRRAPTLTHAKLLAHRVDFGALPPFPAADEVYLALGTTMRQAGSRAAFRAVDLDANLAVARTAFQAGARRLGLVSAAGANRHSPFFYNRVKAQLEDALAALDWTALVIARPSLLLGDRASLAQAPRAAERAAARLGQHVGHLVPGAWRPIDADRVAQALLALVPSAQGRRVLGSAALQDPGRLSSF